MKEPVAILAVKFTEMPTHEVAEQLRERIIGLEGLPTIDDILILVPPEGQETFEWDAVRAALGQMLRHYTIKQIVRFNDFIGIGRT